MTKREFLARLSGGLKGLPSAEIEERINFYSEMIDDGVEDGLSEQESVEKIGDVEQIIAQIISETSFKKLLKERKLKTLKLNSTQILILAVSSPVWLSLLLSAVAVVLALFVSFLAIIISIWAVLLAFGASSFGGIILGFINIFSGNSGYGVMSIGAGIG